MRIHPSPRRARLNSVTKLATAALLASLSLVAFPSARGSAETMMTPAVMFVTQAPFGGDFTSTNATFGNHEANTGSTPRGGDLWIRYMDGTLRNLTQQAGLGTTPLQEIAVREPSVHWDGNKALVSMVIGGTTQDVLTPVYWQIYEVTGIGQGQTVQFRKIAQPDNYNNVSPIYGTNDRIIFTSDRPRNGKRSSYPQLDEYESQPTNTGIWSMNPDGSDLKLLDHAISGAFTPIIASDGRVIFTRWDHLQRDQQNIEGTNDYGAFNYASESSSLNTGGTTEIYPEPRVLPGSAYEHGHTINQFFPWQVNEDGTALETLNHVGRHELISYFDSSNDDLPEFIAPENRRTATNTFHYKEDPLVPGRFYATRAPEFATHAAGQIVALSGGESVNPDSMQFEYITDPNTANPIPDGQTPPPNYAGHFRNPTPLSDGTLIAVRTTSPYDDNPTGTPLSSLYDFHLVRLTPGAPYYTPGTRLIPTPISKTISYWDNYSYQQLNYSGPMWELDPVEVRVRTRPSAHQNPLPSIENQILLDELGGQPGVDRLRSWLTAHNVALIAARNVTRRADRQQPFNLRIAGGGTQTSLPGATVTDLLYAQFFQADLVRGYTLINDGGRRPIAQVMHEGRNPLLSGAPPGSTQLGLDGSMAAIVPARRALSWQVTSPAGASVIRERYWLTFASGEIRSCANCHGINSTDTVLGQPSPTNPPQAFRDLVRWWRDNSAGGTVGDTVGVFVPSSSTFFLRNAHNGGGADLAFGFGPGNSGWTPLSGDWDGDGYDTPGFYAPTTGTFFLRNTSTPGPADIVFSFGAGNAGYIPITGDWDNDGRDTVGIYQPSSGTFFLRNLNVPGGADLVFTFGPAGAFPVAGDWNGDGEDSIGIYVGSSGAFFLRNTTTPGAADIVFTFGPGGLGWTPVAGDWNADAVDSVGLYVPASGTFFLRNGNTNGPADHAFSFGPASGVLPVRGNWNGA